MENSVIEKLSPRELEVAQMVHQGKSAVEGGKALNMSPRTFENHLRMVYARTGASGSAQLAVMVEKWLSLKLQEKGGAHADEVGGKL